MSPNRLLLTLAAVVLSSATVLAAPPPPASGSSAVAVAPGRVSGIVRDSTSGDVLIGANVRIEGTSIGASTDIDGRYSIGAVPAGPQTLLVSYIGYETRRIPVTVPDGGTVTVDIALPFAVAEGQEVVVTAQLAGQLGAINEQLNSNTISNVVSAERIRELPDANAAESIGRLPGISLQRSSGEANRVVVRGLSPQFNQILVNGVRVPSTDANNRSVDLTTISPEALAGIQVFKALPADFEADAIGGTVNLRLRTAPTGLHGSGQAQGGYNELQNSFGNYRFSGNASNRFLGDRLGLIVGGNVERVDRSADNLFGGFGRETVTDTAGVESFRILANNLRVAETLETRNRYGGSLVADFRYPSGVATFNTFVSRLDADETYRQNFLDPQNSAQQFILGQSSNIIDLQTGALNVLQRVGPFEIDATASYARSLNRSPDSRQWSFVERGAFRPGFDRVTASLDSLQSFALNNVDNTNLADVSLFQRRTEETEATFRADVRYPFSFGTLVSGSVSAGGMARSRKRTFDQSSQAENLFFGGTQNLRNIIAADQPNLVPGVANPALLPFSAFLDPSYSPGAFLGGTYTLGNTARLDELNRIADVLRDTLRFDALQSFANDYDGTESYAAGFVMTELRIGRYVTFVPGLRYERMNTEYTGFRIQDTGGFPTASQFADNDSTVARSNDYFFPQLLLTVRPTDWLDLRAARTRTLTRPNYSQLTPSQFIPQSGDFVNRGNPLLEPAVSSNYDLAVALHDDRLGLFSAGYFRKSVAGFITNARPLLLENCTIPGVTRPCAIQGADENAVVSLPVNNPFDATINGVEFDLQTSLFFLPSYLSGIVLNVNYTRVSSSTTYPFQTRRDEIIFEPEFLILTTQVDSSRTGRLVDQPSDILNAAIGYDLGRFSSRLSLQYTANVQRSLDGQNVISDQYNANLLRMDFSAKQGITDELDLYLNLNNLTSAVDRSYVGTSQLYPSFSEFYGITGDLGVRYRF